MSSLFNDDFLDTLAVVGFVIGVMNYNENLNQSDKDDMIQQFSKKAEELLNRLENDLNEQNIMLKDIIDRLEKLEKGG